MNLSKMQLDFETLAKDFYNLFHTMLSIYDKNMNLIYSYPRTLGPFCNEIRKNKILEKQCLAHDKFAFEICRQTLSPYVYHCHMGLVEVAEPVVKNGVILGYLLFGQITDDANHTLIKDCISALQIGPDHDILYEHLKDVIYYPQNYIQSMANILVMSAAYIQLNDIYNIRTDSMSYLITEYIQQNISGNVTVENICVHFGISRSSLYTLSLKSYNMGISEYINSIRVNVAKQLLRTQNFTITDVAQAVGFSDSNYFTKVFKRFANCTPKDYRAQYKNV